MEIVSASPGPKLSFASRNSGVSILHVGFFSSHDNYRRPQSLPRLCKGSTFTRLFVACKNHRQDINSPPSTATNFLRKFAVDSVVVIATSCLLVVLGSTSASAIPNTVTPTAATAAKQQESEENEVEEKFVRENDNIIEDEETKVAFEKWKAKTYALTVPLRIVAVRNSLPPVWIKDFLLSQGKRVKVLPEFRGSLRDIFDELSMSFEKGKVTSKSVAAADVISLGDSWLSYAINKGLIEPMQGVEGQEWFTGLSDKWKGYLCRNSEGKLDQQGRIWAAPYRWGCMVIAYKKSEFQKRNLAPVEDWSDLWRPDLTGKISMIDSPRDIVGTVLKYMGASYNTSNIDSQVPGGINAVQQNLALLVEQVRLFDSQHYLKAFGVGDVWVAVGWSTDILPAAKRMSNVAVIVPKSGASLWADFWAVPAASRLGSDQIGGRVRGPSPLVQQWIEFCLQAQRELPFKEEAFSGSSPIAFEAPVGKYKEVTARKPKLDTNLITGKPPPEILAKCEFLEPLSDDAFSEYKWLINSIKKPTLGMIQRLQLRFSSVVQNLRPKMQSKVS